MIIKTMQLKKEKSLNLTFPALASLTLSACGGGGGGQLSTSAPNPNSIPIVAGTTTVTMDEDSSNIALSISTPTDSDGDSLTVTVTGLPTGGTLTTADGTEVTNDMTLTISQLTGLIFTPDLNLNDDNTSFGSFTYSVSDGTASSAGTVNISVTPVNDIPEFTSGPDLAIEENRTDISGFSASDVDDDTLTYSISGGDDQSFFTIDAATGLLQFIDRPDFENAQDSDANNVYVIEMTIDDGNGGTATQTFNIIVSDVVTGITISNSSIDENDSGAVVGDLTAAIDDLNATHEYTYALSGVDADKFEVIDGQLKLKAGVTIDSLSEPRLNITVTTTDKGGLTYQEEFTLKVGTVQITSLQFEENAVGAIIGDLSVIDTGFSGTITYTLSGAGSENFEIVNGQLKLIDTFSANYEVLSSYEITITATDDSGYTKSTTYPFTVIDVNDAPTGTSLSNMTIDENDVGGIVGDLTTTDEDSGDTHTYALTGNDAEYFEVVNGQLKLKDGVSTNYEEKNSYNVTVTSTDSGGLSIASDYTVTINDINDAPTAINISGSLYVNDGTTGGVVGNITTEDEDAGDSHTYTLSGTNAANFEIVNGQLKLKDSITADHSMKSTYTVTVTSTDIAGLAISENYTVEVNVAPTFVSLSSTNVDENYVGSIVGAITVVDPNTNDDFTYVLGGEDASNFEVVGGELRVKSGSWFDYETKSTYTVSITVIDQGGLSTVQTFNINVNDVNYGNPYHSEVTSAFVAPISDDEDIRGLQWTYGGNGENSLIFQHDNDPDTPLVITYSLIHADSVLGDNYDDGYDQDVYNNTSDYSQEWETMVDQAFTYWGEVSGITFLKVDDNASMCGDIRIGLSTGDFGGAGGWANVPYYYQGENNSTANDIWIRKQYDPEVYGSIYGPMILIHEIGHVLGLAHTHDNGYLSSINDNTNIYSVMSYIGWGQVVNDWPDDGFYANDWLRVESPAINDIAAIQYLYGMRPDFNLGNTTYAFSGPIYTTIYDTGGKDTIDLSSYSIDSSLDLRGGSVSYIGTDELELEVPYGNASWQYDYVYSGFPLGIEENTVIENAITGSGNDTITCNTAINTITCGLGNDDVLLIGSGDIVFGGHGYDNFYINSFDFNLIDGGVGTDVTDGEGDGLYFHGLYTGSVIDLRAFTDNQITNIEDIYIDDGKASILKISALALRNLEGSYFRDMDGDGIEEFVCYIYADADLDEVQVNTEGWVLTAPVDTGDNVYAGYDYYLLSGTLLTPDIWFAINTGTTVTYLNESGGTVRISPDRSNDEMIIAENKNPVTNVDDNPVINDDNNNINIPINHDPFRFVCGCALCTSQDTIKSKYDGNTSNYLDKTSDLLLVEQAYDYSILLPETIESDIQTAVNLSKSDLFGLLIDEEVSLEEEIIFSAIENIDNHGPGLAKSNEMESDSFISFDDYGLFNFYEDSIYDEIIIYTSELG